MRDDVFAKWPDALLFPGLCRGRLARTKAGVYAKAKGLACGKIEAPKTFVCKAFEGRF